MRLALLVSVALTVGGALTVHALDGGEAEDGWSEVVVEVEDAFTVKAERR